MEYVKYLLAAFTINASGASLIRQIYTIASGFQLSISPKANTVPVRGILTSSRGNPKPPMGVISVAPEEVPQVAVLFLMLLPVPLAVKRNDEPMR